WESMLVQGDDLAVKDGLSLQFPQYIGDRREAFGQVIVIAGIQRQFAIHRCLSDGSESIPLQLKKPTFAVKGFLDQLGDHRGDHLERFRGLKPVSCCEDTRFSCSGLVSD